jgi:putative membrane protein insertion efficiency factor
VTTTAHPAYNHPSATQHFAPYSVATHFVAPPAPAVDNAPHTTPVKAALFALRFYKAYLSLLFAGNCRFAPTCSQYMYEAIERFGASKGIWLGLKRLAHCHPFSKKFGYDPIPDEVHS